MEDSTTQAGQAINLNYHVLLVEDQPTVRLIHSNFLQALGCVVSCAENGEQALSLLNNLFDIVFMDMGLPVMSGIDVVKIYRLNEKNEHLPIIALTAYGGKDDRQKFIEAGVDEVLVKPVTIQQLNQVILRWCAIE